MFKEYDSFINLGGFANISKHAGDNLIAYDICPVNILLNYFSRKIGKEYDNKGLIASSGKFIFSLYQELSNLEYYKLDPPKSLGIEWINDKVIPIINKYADSPVEDILNTLSNHIANQISNNLYGVKKVLVTGGGAYNDYLIEIIESTSEFSLDKLNPDIVAIPTNHSHHQDHIVVFNAAIAAPCPLISI